MHLAMHPAIGQRPTMSAHELAFFTDAPIAHEVAYRDFQRDLIIEARNAAARDAFLRRDREARRAAVAQIAWGE